MIKKFFENMLCVVFIILVVSAGLTVMYAGVILLNFLWVTYEQFRVVSSVLFTVVFVITATATWLEERK